MNKDDLLLNKKIVIKSLVWECLGLIIIFLLTKSLKIGILYLIIRLVTYYIYEIIWAKYARI